MDLGLSENYYRENTRNGFGNILKTTCLRPNDNAQSFFLIYSIIVVGGSNYSSVVICPARHNAVGIRADIIWLSRTQRTPLGDLATRNQWNASLWAFNESKIDRSGYFPVIGTLGWS